MNFLGTVVLETERLIIRPFNAGDARDMFHNWANNSHVTRYLICDYTLYAITKDQYSGSSYVKRS
ncbi:hypothetical protein LAD12857_41230 [Lacrimispora amygdalina]|uniref:Uncharacterized protein n=1 Tax=Lacrimispora amygdalina TaxID=253257 RepID=A0ABQ5MBJ3_9FIRM